MRREGLTTVGIVQSHDIPAISVTTTDALRTTELFSSADHAEYGIKDRKSNGSFKFLMLGGAGVGVFLYALEQLYEAANRSDFNLDQFATSGLGAMTAAFLLSLANRGRTDRRIANVQLEQIRAFRKSPNLLVEKEVKHSDSEEFYRTPAQN